MMLRGKCLCRMERMGFGRRIRRKRQRLPSHGSILTTGSGDPGTTLLRTGQSNRVLTFSALMSHLSLRAAAYDNIINQFRIGAKLSTMNKRRTRGSNGDRVRCHRSRRPSPSHIAL
jgi:hypothetical protein